jgi:hypothetical protein
MEHLPKRLADRGTTEAASELQMVYRQEGKRRAHSGRTFVLPEREGIFAGGRESAPAPRGARAGGMAPGEWFSGRKGHGRTMPCDFAPVRTILARAQTGRPTVLGMISSDESGIQLVVAFRRRWPTLSPHPCGLFAFWGRWRDGYQRRESKSRPACVMNNTVKVRGRYPYGVFPVGLDGARMVLQTNSPRGGKRNAHQDSHSHHHPHRSV